eukprot:scaffold735_cov255-Pinguiococcus_pyrenoidosus.AAC.27
MNSFAIPLHRAVWMISSPWYPIQWLDDGNKNLEFTPMMSTMARNLYFQYGVEVLHLGRLIPPGRR